MAKGGQSRPRMRHKIVVRKLQESGSKAGEVDVLVDNNMILLWPARISALKRYCTAVNIR
jgi:hypothetical protein